MVGIVPPDKVRTAEGPLRVTANCKNIIIPVPVEPIDVAEAKIAGPAEQLVVYATEGTVKAVESPTQLILTKYAPAETFVGKVMVVPVNVKDKVLVEVSAKLEPK